VNCCCCFIIHFCVDFAETKKRSQFFFLSKHHAGGADNAAPSAAGGQKDHKGGVARGYWAGANHGVLARAFVLFFFGFSKLLSIVSVRCLELKESILKHSRLFVPYRLHLVTTWRQVSGKKKKGGVWLQPRSVICRVHCDDDTSYVVASGAHGKLVEVQQTPTPHFLFFLSFCFPSLLVQFYTALLTNPRCLIDCSQLNKQITEDDVSIVSRDVCFMLFSFLSLFLEQGRFDTNMFCMLSVISSAHELGLHRNLTRQGKGYGAGTTEVYECR
jgi:hypothetical protein